MLLDDTELVNPDSDESGEFTLTTEPMEMRSRSMSERYFSKMRFGSFRGSIFTLTATAFTPAIMVLPYILSQTGLILSSLIIFWMGLVIMWGQYQQADSFFEYGEYNYSRLGERVTGKRWVYYLMEFWIVLYEIGVIIGNNILLAQFLLEIFYLMGAGFVHEDILLLFVVNIAIINPFSLMRSVSGFRFAALLAIGSITYIVVLVIIEFPLYSYQTGVQDVNFGAMTVNFPTAFNLGLFTFFCHPNVGPIQKELSFSNAERMKIVIFRSNIINIAINLTLAFFAYLSTLDDTPQVFIARSDPDRFNPDWAMLIGKIFYMVVLILSTVLNLFPAKKSIIDAMNKRDSIWTDRIVTCVLVWFSYLIAVVYPNILGVLSIVGGISVVGLALIIPMVLNWHMEQNVWKKYTTLTGISILGLLSFTSLIITIIYIQSANSQDFQDAVRP